MRVLQLTQRFPPAIGGVEDHVLHLSLKLRERGVDVRVATTDLRRDVPFERLRAVEERQPFPVVRYRARKLLEAPHGLGIASPAMVFAALEHGTDIVHAHAYGYFPTWVGSLARSLDGAALVLTTHSDAGTPRMSKRLFDRITTRFVLRRASRIIALTAHEASLLESRGVPAERIVVIPDGVDVDEFTGIPPRPVRTVPIALFVGRLYPQQKGLETLVRALALLPSSVDLKVRLMGEDWGGAALVQRLASDLQVGGRIAVIGPVSRTKLLQEYAAADLLVLPSLFEPFGIVLLEAMAAGLPVVASRVGGIPEVVAEGETGLLVKPGDESELASALLRLAKDADLRRRLGERGRQRSASYAWEALVPRILRAYEEALQERA